MNLLFDRPSSESASLSLRSTEVSTLRYHYQQFVDLVLASKDLDATGVEALYANFREGMSAIYPRVRPYVIAYLKFSTTDADACLDFCGESGDAFQALYFSSSFEQVLKSDKGTLLDRLQRTASALELYERHIEKLQAVKAVDAGLLRRYLG